MKTYEIQLGRIKDGAKDGNIDYDSPQLILLQSNRYPNIEEVETAYTTEIKSLDCDCVYGITEVEEWELEQYECYKTVPKYTMQAN